MIWIGSGHIKMEASKATLAGLKKELQNLLHQRRRQKMLHIKFRYRDAMSNWKWRTQSCTVSSVEECKRIYGLDNGDVKYEILEIKEIDK